MNSYLEVITLNQAKTYLRIDENQTATDNEIMQMINSALSYIEKRTGWIMFIRDKTYFGDGSVNVYDAPINTTDVTMKRYNNYSVVTTVDGEVTLNVGATLITEIPTELVNAGLALVNFYYYNSETKNSENSIPDFINASIDTCRRFI